MGVMEREEEGALMEVAFTQVLLTKTPALRAVLLARTTCLNNIIGRDVEERIKGRRGEVVTLWVNTLSNTRATQYRS